MSKKNQHIMASGIAVKPISAKEHKRLSFGEFGQYASQSDLITVELPILKTSVVNGVVNLVNVPVPF